jgi:hypothetical protein
MSRDRRGSSTLATAKPEQKIGGGTRRVRFQPEITTALALGLAGLLAGCGGGLPRSVGMTDRCADIMKAAMPFAEIEIGKTSAAAEGIDKITADVEGTRKDVPAGTPPRLAAQCIFVDSVLTGFSWTKGGPGPRP